MVKRRMLINAAEVTESRIAVVLGGKLEEYYTERSDSQHMAGNIYKAAVVNVERSLQAAFVNIGGSANGFLQAGDISYQAAGRKSRHRSAARKGTPLVQDLLRPEQELLVQVTKEAIGKKGPALTTHIGIPGRYLVLMPFSSHIGVSKKIEDEKQRQELKKMLKELNPPQNLGVIIRTAGADRTKRELQKDLNYLSRVWKAIQNKSKSAKAPMLVYKESDLAIRTVRDIFSPDMEEIIVDSREVHRSLTEFFTAVMPRYKNRVKLFPSATPIFDHYEVQPMVEEIYKRKIALPQGGSIVIDETEALVAIDVNSGRFKTKNAEETSFKIDMQAAEEVVRQIKLRDLGGLIVIDFIDMKKHEHIRKLERRVRDLMKTDRARHSMTRISQFGTMQITRQRLRPSLQHRSSGICPQCGGTGRIRNLETVSLEALRKIKAEIPRNNVTSLRVILNPKAAEEFQNNMRAQLAELENTYDKKIIITSEPFIEIGEIRTEQAN